jgi:meso-butanediol dehydrogenase/(S,S)-butanediol dehydrogenase/diacetyl reductase
MARRLEHRVALITGGGTGIGAATARRFAAEGASVVLTGRRAGPIEAVADEVAGVAVTGDVRDDAHLAAAVSLAVERFHGLDIVVANAGIDEEGDVASVGNETWLGCSM